MTRKVRPQRGAVVEREVPMARTIGLRSHASSRRDILSIGPGRHIPEVRDSPTNEVEGRGLLPVPKLLLAPGKFLKQKDSPQLIPNTMRRIGTTIPEISFQKPVHKSAHVQTDDKYIMD